MKIISALFIVLICSSSAFSQQNLFEKDYALLNLRVINSGIRVDTTENSPPEREEFPDPTSVLYKSLMIPGWGQIINNQAWKVPIIYGMFAGIGYFTYTVHQDYKDYRAAFYNAQRGEDTDFKFGPTPDELQGVNSTQLRENRNSLRNRRDLMLVVMVLAHGLNAVDAYVFAHMRSFDVSDDLSARASLSPDLLADSAPAVTLKIQLNKK